VANVAALSVSKMDRKLQNKGPIHIRVKGISLTENELMQFAIEEFGKKLTQHIANSENRFTRLEALIEGARKRLERYDSE
jgi:Mn-dependent DtxR family transcriptional regulator